jgi:hypothetical protein
MELSLSNEGLAIRRRARESLQTLGSQEENAA